MSFVRNGALAPLVAIALTALNLRTAVTGFPPLLDMIGEDLGFGSSLYGLLGTFVTGCFAVFGFVAALVARRVGLDIAIAGAVVITTAGLAVRSLSGDPAAFVISTVLALTGVGCSNVLVVPLVKRYFPDHIKSMSSMYLALLQVGQFAAPLIAVPVAAAWGWRWALGMWAVPTAVAAAVWIILARRSTSLSGRPDASAQAGKRLRAAWRTPLLWAMVLMLGVTALNVYALITWLPTILVDAGADSAQGGALLALFSAFGLVAAFVVPPLTVRLRNPFMIVVACALLMATGYLGLLASPRDAAVLCVVLLGLGVSTFPLCLTLVNVRTRTTAGSTLLSGAMQGIGYGIACLGPVGIGLIHEASGEWAAPCGVLLGSLVLLVVSGAIACRPSMLEDQIAQIREQSPITAG
ncbi:MFS transporter [Microbacterium sp. NPDC019599]|uniref:MFS transporter n=1 Tax=Microbacterium sp. NPDC019599 TaxID=3154690 RepID=UPI0033F9B08F